jgi:hypothetical protein
MLTDDQPNPAAWPTHANMVAQMQRLVSGACAGDSLLFHFSGGPARGKRTLHAALLFAHPACKPAL